MTSRIHGHGVNLHAQESGVDQNSSRGIELGDEAALCSGVFMKDVLRIRAAIKRACCGGVVDSGGKAANINIVAAVQPDMGDESVCRKSALDIQVLARV